MTFGGWNTDCPKQSLLWWEAFDDIKHSRIANIQQGSLQNVVHMLSALFMLEMKYLKNIYDGSEPDIPDKVSEIFELADWEFRYIPLGNGFTIVDGRLCITTRK